MYWELYMHIYIYSWHVISVITFSLNYQVLLFILGPVSNSLEIFRSQSICQCWWQSPKVRIHSQPRRDHYWVSNRNLHKAFLRKLLLQVCPQSHYVPFPPSTVSWQGQSPSKTARLSSGKRPPCLFGFSPSCCSLPWDRPAIYFPINWYIIFKSLE